MSVESGTATVHFAGNDLFLGISPSGHAVAMDTNHERNSAPSPIELLLVSLGACSGVDVVSILRKQRQEVVDYRIEISGQRRDEHPRGFTRMEVRHIVKGRNISASSLAKAIELSESKYCSVAATLRPTVEIVSSFELIEADS